MLGRIRSAHQNCFTLHCLHLWSFDLKPPACWRILLVKHLLVLNACLEIVALV